MNLLKLSPEKFIQLTVILLIPSIIFYLLGDFYNQDLMKTIGIVFGLPAIIIALPTLFVGILYGAFLDFKKK